MIGSPEHEQEVNIRPTNRKLESRHNEAQFKNGSLFRLSTVEGAIKFARASTGKAGIIASMRGFHGKTFGALAVTWGSEYKQPFMPMLQGVTHVPYNNFLKLKESVNADTAAVILECVQGEGGVRVGDKDYFRQVRDLCDSRGILFAIDEVQTGFGRTDTLFAYEQFAEPDLLCVAESLAGGIPMGAVLCS